MNRFEGVTKPLMWFTALLLSALLAGCEGGRGSILGAGVSLASAPTVTSTAPANLDPAVPTNTKVITATFSKAMAPATLNSPATTFTVRPSGVGTTALAGTVSYATVGSTATLTLTGGNLLGNTQYVAIITTAATDTTSNALASNFVWTFVTSATPDTTAPIVSLTAPADAATGVLINRKVTASFNEAMNPTTISGTSFTLTSCTNAAAVLPCVSAVAVPGAVTYAAVGATVTFTPTSNLTANTVYAATITSAVTDAAGNPLVTPVVGGTVPNPWIFRTGPVGGVDIIAPQVNFTNPVDLATNVSVITKAINARFSEPMDPATISNLTFTLTAPLLLPVAGLVSYDPLNSIATFAPSADLDFSTQYTAQVKNVATDLAGNALVSGPVPNPWTFTTAAAPVIAPLVDLKTVAPFGTFGGSAGMTNTGTLTVISGTGANIGTIATGTSAITGFHEVPAPPGDIYTETPANIGAVNGKIFTCTVSTTGPTSTGVNATSCAIATQARLDAESAYLTLEGMAPVGQSPAPGGNLAGKTLLAGVYKAPAGSFLIQGPLGTDDLTLSGSATDIWVFQMATSLTVGGPGAAFPRSIILAGGALAKNVYWQVGSAATINAAGGGTMVGTIISQAGAAFSTAGNTTIVTLNGRVLSLGASVTLVDTVINVPAP